jgi:hypothetical protein
MESQRQFGVAQRPDLCRLSVSFDVAGRFAVELPAQLFDDFDERGCHGAPSIGHGRQLGANGVGEQTMPIDPAPSALRPQSHGENRSDVGLSKGGGLLDLASLGRRLFILIAEGRECLEERDH